jgi:hypothetical protein
MSRIFKEAGHIWSIYGRISAHLSLKIQLSINFPGFIVTTVRVEVEAKAYSYAGVVWALRGLFRKLARGSLGVS